MTATSAQAYQGEDFQPSSTMRARRGGATAMRNSPARRPRRSEELKVRRLNNETVAGDRVFRRTARCADGVSRAPISNTLDALGEAAEPLIGVEGLLIYGPLARKLGHFGRDSLVVGRIDSSAGDPEPDGRDAVRPIRSSSV